jgi:hypothetical protein
MSIQDLVGNPLAPATQAQVIGFDEPPPVAELLPLRMYQFLIRPIREQDATEGQNGGNLFVKRFLQGPQTLWERIQARLFEVKDLWDLERIEDEYLNFLKNVVGWTDTVALKRITDPLDATALRRLIGSSVPLWKQRGPEDTIVDILQLLTAKRARTWSWFETRWVNDESAMEEDHQGRDPFIIDLPGPPNYDDQRYNVRIVDDGNEPLVDRNLVREVVKLMRPAGERATISYLLFLDRFLSQSDDFQWKSQNGAQFLTVEDGLLKLEDTSGETACVSVGGSEAWTQYNAYVRCFLFGTGKAHLHFHRVDDQNYYSIIINVANNWLRLRKFVGGAPTTLDTFDFSSIAETLTTDEWFGLRVTTIFEGSDLRIRCYLGNNERINYLDTSSPHAAGTVAIQQEASKNVHVDEVEVFGLPVDSEEVNINPV